MTKAELIAAVSEKTDFTKKDAERAITAVLDVITETLAEGEKVSLVGFGTFEVKDRAERMGHNPQTGITSYQTPHGCKRSCRRRTYHCKRP